MLVTVSVLLYGAAVRTVPDAEDKLSRLPSKCVFVGAHGLQNNLFYTK